MTWVKCEATKLTKVYQIFDPILSHHMTLHRPLVTPNGRQVSP